MSVTDQSLSTRPLDGCAVLVTGASSGFGARVATGLAAVDAGWTIR